MRRLIEGISAGKACRWFGLRTSTGAPVIDQVQGEVISAKWHNETYNMRIIKCHRETAARRLEAAGERSVRMMKDFRVRVTGAHHPKPPDFHFSPPIPWKLILIKASTR